MKLFLVATDGSAASCRAVTVAVQLARAEGGKLIVISAEAQRLMGAPPKGVAPQISPLSKRILSDACNEARAAGLTDVQTEAQLGDPAEVIIDAIRRHHVDVVVVGRRGQGRLSGLLLGGVAQKLASLAPCIVVIVP